MPAPTKCRACGTEIVFIKNPTTKRIVPVDAQPVLLLPDKTGTEHGFDSVRWLPVRGRIIPQEQNEQYHDAVSVHVSHFRTCTDPGRFSGKGRGAQ